MTRHLSLTEDRIGGYVSTETGDLCSIGDGSDAGAGVLSRGVYQARAPAISTIHARQPLLSLRAIAAHPVAIKARGMGPVESPETLHLPTVPGVRAGGAQPEAAGPPVAVCPPALRGKQFPPVEANGRRTSRVVAIISLLTAILPEGVGLPVPAAPPG